MDAWSRQTFYYRKRIPDYRTEGVVGGDSNNMYIEAVSQTFLKSLRVTCEYSNNMVPVLFNKKSLPFEKLF
jgi:hypothetical protein